MGGEDIVTETEKAENSPQPLSGNRWENTSIKLGRRPGAKSPQKRREDPSAVNATIRTETFKEKESLRGEEKNLLHTHRKSPLLN